VILNPSQRGKKRCFGRRLNPWQREQNGVLTDAALAASPRGLGPEGVAHIHLFRNRKTLCMSATPSGPNPRGPLLLLPPPPGTGPARI